MRTGLFRTVRKGVAGLLVLALLALSAAPISARLQTTVERSGGHHHAAADCGTGDPGAAPSTRDPEGPARDGHGLPALACCAALQCPMLLADLQPAPAEALRPVGPGVRATASARHPAGLDIPPAVPPPREAV